MDKYNLTFTIRKEEKVYEKLRQNIQAGDQSFSLAIDAPCNLATLAAEQNLMALDNVPHVNLEADWWNQTVMNDMSVFGKHYIGFGDMTIKGMSCAGAIFYSKALGAKYQLDPYTLVREGKWTFDKMIEYCHTVSSDLDGKGWDEKDQYGAAYNNFAWQILFLA